MPELADAGDHATIIAIVERLVDGLIHCVDPRTTLQVQDIDCHDYRDEVILCALWMLSIVNVVEKPSALLESVESMKTLIYESSFSSAEANMKSVQWLLSPGTDRTDPEFYRYLCGRVIALMAYECVLSYKMQITTPLQESEALQLVSLLIKMAQT